MLLIAYFARMTQTAFDPENCLHRLAWQAMICLPVQEDLDGDPRKGEETAKALATSISHRI
jgi:hypothetical protein